MGSTHKLLAYGTDLLLHRLGDPVGLTTPVVSDDGTKPVWIEGDDLGGAATHIADTTDAHDASAISIVDTGGYYTSTDVEGALQEAATMGGGSGVTVEEVDGAPSVASVTTIKVSNGTLTNNGGGTVTVTTGAGVGASWPYTEVIKGSDEDRTSTTVPAADGALSFATTANHVYEVEVIAIFASPLGGGTPDIRIAIGEDATLRGSFSAMGLSGGNAANTNVLGADQTSVVQWGTATTKRIGRIIGSYAGNGSPFQVLWSQVVSGANPTTMYAGSILRYRDVT